MTMRATVERDGATGTDGFGQPNAPAWATHLAALPCYAWARSETEIVDGSKIAVVGYHTMLVPAETDILETDRITSIKDRAGTVLVGNTMRIASVLRRSGHLALTLEEVK